MERRKKAANTAPFLPPVELRLQEFRDPGAPSFQRLETPVTDIGLVDTPKLLKLVKGTLNAAYKWPSQLDDVHHLLWPNSAYPGEELQRFRNLSVNKKDWPRIFHNWAHKVTVPSAIPPADTLHFIPIVQESINDASSCVQVGKMLTRNPDITEASLKDRLEELFDSFNIALDNIENLAPEYHLLNPSEFRVANVEEMLAINGQLGRLAMVSTVGAATRYIRQTTHAPLRLSANAA